MLHLAAKAPCRCPPLSSNVSRHMVSDTPRIRTALATAGGIVLLQCAIGGAIYFGLPDWQTRGQFGDLFGAVNATFSGLAFAGLIYAILLQRNDLALQRVELQLTREELQRSAAAQEQSEIALRAQAEAAATSAKLAATNFLLAEYKKELSAMQQQALRANDPRLGRMAELERRVNALTAVLDSVYQAIAGENNARV
jgi:hypothetical protein